MARFRGTLQGARGEASRLGTPKTGLTVTCNGWDAGVNIQATAGPGDADTFAIYMTGGSNGGPSKLLGTVSLLDGVPTFAREPKKKA